MNLALDRGLALLEHLSRNPDGLPLALMAQDLDIPLSACHRLLADLQQRGYVRQKRKQGDYQLTTKVVSIGLGYLSHGGMVDIAGPLLERLAQLSGELVRLSIVDDDRLTFVAKAQGAVRGLRYDPDQGIDVRLSCTASGLAWLSTLPEGSPAATCSPSPRRTSTTSPPLSRIMRESAYGARSGSTSRPCTVSSVPRSCTTRTCSRA